MKMSDKGLRMLVTFEVTIVHTYLDVAGIETVCTGHVVLPNDRSWVDDGVTADECKAALGRDVARFERCVTETGGMPQPMFDACVSLAFNIGEAAFRSSTVASRLEIDNWSGAADAFLMWRFAKVKQKDGSYLKLPVLEGRRQAEAALFRTGIQEALGMKANDEPSLEHLASLAFSLNFSVQDMLDNAHVNDNGALEALQPDEEVA